ncbi:MAG: hypothetical protein FWC23_00140 [Chitinispirillia bacterium]|nr:hypothetical protein [Chitinispirillia bacterium]
MAVFCVFLAACERSDVITGAGGSVVTGMDTTLTDTRRGFALLTLGPGDVDSAFSLPAAGDPAFSTQAHPYTLIGLNRDGDTLAAHAQFRAGAFLSRAGTALYTHSDSLLEAHIYFRATDSTNSPEPVALFPSDTLTGLNPVNRGDSAISGSKMDEWGLQHTGDEEGEPGMATNIGELDLSGAFDSLLLPKAIAKKLFDARTSTDTAAFHALAVSIVNYCGPLRRLNIPYIIMRVNKTDGKTVRDSIPGYARFSAFEANTDVKAALPYSSQHTLRTAVFKVNIGKILDSLDVIDAGNARSELINAVIALSINRNVLEEEDGEPDDGDVRISSHNINNYRAVISDTLLTNEIPADSADAVALRSLRGQFGSVSSTAPTTPFNTHSVKFTIRGIIEKRDSGRLASPYIYIYLRPFTEGGMILWENPPKVETIFTPSRSQ